MLWKRVVSSLVALPFLFLFLYVFPPWALPLGLTAISVLAVHELLASTKFVKNRAILISAVLFSCGVVPWVYLGSDYGAANMAVFLLAAVLFALALGSQRQVTLEQIAGAFFAAVFIPLSFSSIIRINRLEDGIYLVLLPFLAAWMTDTCAYFAGVYLGRTKLAPGISPNKTWEGFVGGLAGCVLGTLLYGLILRRFYVQSVSFPVLSFTAVLGSASAQFGDLCLSYIKRQFDIKDFGRIMPGHGGLLDRFDSLLFAAPMVELVLTVTKSLVL